MPIAFLLPSLIYGAYLAATTGNLALLFLSGGSVLVWAIFGNQAKLTGDVRFENGRTYIGKRRLHRFVFLWPASIRDLVFEAAFAKSSDWSDEHFYSIARRKPWLLGLGSAGEVYLPVGQGGHHCLVVGPTGSGKTELLRNLAINFESDLIAIDFKGGLGLAPLEPMKIFTNQSDSPEDFWQFLSQLLDYRERGLITGDTPNQLLLVVDELALVLTSGQSAQRVIERVVSQGRSLGVVMLAATQTLSGISRVLLANCTLRIAIGAIDSVDLAQLGVNQRAETHVSGRGHASLIVDGKLSGFRFSPLWVFPEKKLAPADSSASANPLMARFAPMHESIHL